MPSEVKFLLLTSILRNMHSDLARQRPDCCPLKGGLHAQKVLFFNSYLDWYCRAVNFLSCGFVGKKHYPKQPTVTPPIRLPVAVDLGWASCDGTIAERAYIMYSESLATYTTWKADQVLYGSYTPIITATTSVCA